MTSSFTSVIQNVVTRVSSIRGSTPILQLSFHPESRLKLVEIPSDSRNNDESSYNEFIPVYSNGSSIAGHLDIILPNGLDKFEYDEISICLIGHVICDNISYENEFLSQKILLTQEAGILTRNTEFDFKFETPELTIDSFYGSLFKCRYFIRAVINRSRIFQSNITTENDFMVRNLSTISSPTNMAVKPVSMQVGVDECLHVKFEYDNINLSTNDCLTGNVCILSNTLKITTMQLQLIRRECLKTRKKNKPEIINSSILGKYEIMDGFPMDMDIIPIRMFLQRFNSINCTQTNEHFTVRYFVNLGLIDKDGRRYFKSCELNLFRKQIM